MNDEDFRIGFHKRSFEASLFIKREERFKSSSLTSFSYFASPVFYPRRLKQPNRQNQNHKWEGILILKKMNKNIFGFVDGKID